MSRGEDDRQENCGKEGETHAECNNREEWTAPSIFWVFISRPIDVMRFRLLETCSGLAVPETRIALPVVAPRFGASI